MTKNGNIDTKSKFGKNIEIFDKKRNIGKNREILAKESKYWEQSKFVKNIETKNLNLGKTLKFLTNKSN